MKKRSMDELNRLSVSDFKEVAKSNFCIVLDDIRSMANVGSIFRTCDAYLASSIYLCGITATPPHREIERTALGATETVNWVYEADILNLILNLKSENYMIVAIEQTDNSVFLQDFNYEKDSKYAFVFGNEVFGVKNEILEIADAVVELPQFGSKHSLNVSVTAGMVIWDYFCANTKG